MSVPPAQTSISETPAKMGVTEPHQSTQSTDKDVEKSMRLYGIIQAFRRGRMPDNHQIDHTFSYILSNPPVDVNKLSPEGRKLVDDVRQLLEVSRLQVHDKNADEALQKFIWHTSDERFRVTAKDKAHAIVGDGSSLPAKEDAQRDGHQAVEHLRTLAQLLVTNSEARKLLSDLTFISRDLFATGAAKAAEKARPDPESLAKIDDPAPSKAWGGAQSENTSEPPSVALGIDIQREGFRSAFKKSAQAFMGKADQKADEKTQAAIQRTKKSDAPPTTQTMAASGSQPTAPVEVSTAPATTTDDYHPSQTVQQVEGTVEQKLEQQPGDSSADAAAKEHARALSSRIPRKHKERATVVADRTKQFFNEEFPQDRRDQFIWRMKKVVTECQSHPSYQGAITWFLDTLEAYFNTAKSASKDQGRTAKGMFGNDPIVQQAWEELRILLERFAASRSLDGVFNAITKLKNDARSDEEFRAWFRRVNEFVRRTFLEPGWILSPQYNQQASTIFQDQARLFFDERYRDHRQLVLDEAHHWVEGFAADPLNKRYGDAWAQLMKDLLMNSEGKLTWKNDLWRDVRNVILPAVAQKVGHVPIPRIEYTDNQLDLVIENLTLQGKNLFPNIIEFVGQTHVRMSPYKTIKDQMDSSITLTLTQIQADMRDVAFYFHKKTGLPRLKDSGLADVFLGGKGITVKLKISSVTKDQQPKGTSNSVIRLESAVAKVDTLRFSIRDSKHDLLYKTMRPLATALIKRQICKAIEDGIRSAFEMADAQIIAARNRMGEAQTSEASVLDQIKSAISAPRESASGAASETSSKVQRRNSRFKVVASRESSLLPSVGHPRGWANKAPSPTEDEAVDAPWKSHAFDIAPASAETNNHHVQAAGSSGAAAAAAHTNGTSSSTHA